MITIKNIAAQGDVLFRKVSGMVPGIPPLDGLQPRSGPLVVAHSETGHDHVINAPDAYLFITSNPQLCYLRFEGPFVDVVHERPFHTHETLRLLGDESGPSYFEVRRQREHSPEDEKRPWRDVQD